MPTRQLTTPLILRGDQVTQLCRVPYEDRSVDEDRLQKLLFEHPELLPVTEIEPIFNGLTPVARELPSAAGPVDLLYINSDGFLALVETKLWRNPEARRSVVAQIIDYAKEMAEWSYRDLVEAVRKARKDNDDDPLVELARESAEDAFDEATFHDAVSRNLRLGRFLLLIVGDGIREDVEHMVEYLQKTPQLGFTLGLIEIGIYRIDDNDDDTLIIQPRILTRTQEVTRAVVEVRNRAAESVDVVVSLPTEMPRPDTPRKRITEEQFFENLETANAASVDVVRWALNEAEKRGLLIEWMDAGPMLKWQDESTGHVFSLVQLHRTGKLAYFVRFAQRCKKLGLPDRLWMEYFDEVAALVPGAARRETRSKSGRVHAMIATGPNPLADAIRIDQMSEKKEAWFDVMDRAIEHTQAALEEADA